MNAERTLFVLFILTIVAIVLAVVVGGIAGYKIGISQLDTVDSNAYWTGWYASCIQVAQLQEESCYSITQTERAKVETR